MGWVGSDTFGAFLDLLRDAAVAGWLATAVFCAVAGVAVALWAGVPWWAGLLLGAVSLYLGLAVLLVVGGIRAGARARNAYVARSAALGAPPTPTPPPPAVTGPPPRDGGAAPAVPAGWAAPATPAGWAAPAAGTAAPAPPSVWRRGRDGVRRGWRWWTRTPPARADVVVAVVALVLAIGLFAATRVTWVELSAVGREVTGLGPFAIQLGLFVVLSALAALVCAAGVLRWRSAWWPVLLAWFATWWLFVALEVMRAEGALTALNRLARDQIRERSGYDVRPELALGVGWSVMVVLGVAMMVLAVALLVLQGRRTSHYPAAARS